MHISDLDLVRYHTGPFSADNWSVPLRAIGWLEHPQAFICGSPPAALISKLRTMVEQVRVAYSHYVFRGVQDCSLCVSAHRPSPGPIWSQENIFVPGADAVYVAPGGIVHYVEAHSYLPPNEFVEAVLQCPDLRSERYREALYTANQNNEPPLESDQSFSARIPQMRRQR